MEFIFNQRKFSRVVGLDTETEDPCLKDTGWSWKQDKGMVLCTALSDGQKYHTVIRGPRYNPEANTPEENDRIRALLLDEHTLIVGANLQYDIGWLLYELHMKPFDVKCTFYDVLLAEDMLEEFGYHSLEELSLKYLKYGKRKEKIDEWVHTNTKCKANEDFRKYLKDAPWDLLCDYVLGDADNPVNIMLKQVPELAKQKLEARAQLEFDCILPSLVFTIVGFPFDEAQRQENCAVLEMCRDRFANIVQSTYDCKGINIGSGVQLAKLFDKHNIPYQCKVSIKGRFGTKFTTDAQKYQNLRNARIAYPGVRVIKKELCCFVPKENTALVKSRLDSMGFITGTSPHIDKEYLDGIRNDYQIAAEVADWRICNNIISKILGDNYTRFLSADGRIRGQFNIADTISFRFSSSTPNLQQIPSKGGLKIDGEEIKFPDLTRALFHADKGMVYGKIDYGQIEYRLICHAAVGPGSEEVRAEYAKNPALDFHQYTVDLTGLDRKHAKNMSFGVSFGMGVSSMASHFGWSTERCQEITTAYNEHMPFVQPTLKYIGDLATEQGYIETVYGSHARLPDANKGYTMLNRFTQGSGAEILKLAMVDMYKAGIMEALPFYTTVHDEFGFGVRPTIQDIERAYQVQEIMCHKGVDVNLKVPLMADLEFGDDWAHTHTVDEWLEGKDDKGHPLDTASMSEELKQVIQLCKQYRESKQ